MEAARVDLLKRAAPIPRSATKGLPTRNTTAKSYALLAAHSVAFLLYRMRNNATAAISGERSAEVHDLDAGHFVLDNAADEICRVDSRFCRFLTNKPTHRPAHVSNADASHLHRDGAVPSTIEVGITDAYGSSHRRNSLSAATPIAGIQDAQVRVVDAGYFALDAAVDEIAALVQGFVGPSG